MRAKYNLSLIVAMALGLAAYLSVSLLWLNQIPNLLPNELTINIVSKSLTVHEIHHKIHDNSILLLFMIPGALFIEFLCTGWEKSSVRRILFARSETIKMDIACLIALQAQVLSLIGRILTLGLASFVGMWVSSHIGSPLNISLVLNNLPYMAQVFVFFLLYTFFDYWTHRIEHWRYFWPLHRFHHSTEDFCVITSLRAHPAAFMGIFIINTPLAILGADPSVMISVNLLVNAIGLILHSSINSTWGWVGRFIIQSPNHHRLHHILDITTPVGHFGILPIWDHLFGTWRGDADQSLVIGVEVKYRHGYFFLHDLLRDYIDFWKGVAGFKVKL